MAPDVMWISMKDKTCLLTIKKIHVAHCQAKVCNKTGRRKVLSRVATLDSSVSTNAHRHSRSTSSMTGSHWLGSLSEVVNRVAMVLLSFV